MLPRRRASAAQSKDLSSSDVPFAMPGPTSDQQYGHYSHDNAAEPTYAEFLSSGDDWLDPYSLSPSESSSSQRRKRSTTCDIKSDSSTMVYATPLRPRARSLRDATTGTSSRKPTSGTTSLLADDTRQGHPSKEKAPTKHSLHHLPRARSRILKSPPPPPVLELDQQPPSLPNVDVQQIKDELSVAACQQQGFGVDCDPTQKPQALPRRQKSLQHHYQQLQHQQQYEAPSKETASVISNVKRKFSLKDRAATSHEHFNTTFARNPTSNGVDGVGRKSRTPSRSSLADYSGSRSSSARRRSVYSSPPPHSRSHGRSNSRQHQKKDDGCGWTTSDEEGGRSSTASNSSTSLMGHYDDGFIPPVPPVPKHHSIKTPIHSINDDDPIPAGLDTAPSQKSSRGTFGSFEEIINAQKTSQGDGGAHHGLLAADLEGKTWDSREIGMVRTSPRVSPRTPKKQHEQHKSMEQDAQNYYAKSSPSLLPRRTSSRKHQHKTSPKMTSLQKPDDGKKVANRKRGRTLPGSLATPPPIQSIPLPPMKLEPIHIALPTNPTDQLSPPRQSSTRIPVPKTSSALSTRSNTSSVNTATGGTTFAYTSSEDEGSLSGSRGKSRRSKTSSALKGSNSTTTTATMALTPPGLTHERRRSLKSASSRLTATSTSPKSSPKPSPKTSPRMKHSRSTSSSGGLSTSSPLSTSLPSTNYLQRKLSRNGQTPLTEPVPKLPTAITTSDYMTGSNYPVPSTKTRQSNHTNNIGTSESSAVAVPSQQKGSGTTLNRTTSLHSTRGQATKGSNSGSDKKDRLRTVSLHGKIHPSTIQEPQFIMMGSNQTVTIPSHPTVEQPKLQQPMAITSNDRDTPSPAAATTPPVRTAKSPHTALKYYAQYLTHYERNEILEFPHIYFIGPHAKKHQASNDTQHQVYNHGYDDENGDYKIIRQDHLLYRYEIVDLLGQGSFGQVVKCYDHKTGATVAIKLIRNKKRFHAQALTEVKILQNLVDWDPEDKHHNIRMTDYFYFRHHLCVAFECMSMNLYEFIKKNNYQGFSVGLIRKFTIQILQSLTLLYKHRVVHCDLKPENILLKNPGRSTIKVIDFGSSCLETERVYTYIQSRFYRSPEVILGISYNMAIDMWSLGCILAELHTGIPLFPGESEQEQLGCIMEVMGLPDRYLIDQSSRKKLFFDSHGNARAVVNSKGKRRQPATKPLAHALRSNDLLFLDFIQGCLQWDPANRMTPMEAMDHDWIQQRTNNTNLASATTSAYQFPSNTNNNYQKLEEFKTKKRQHHHPPTTPKMTATAYYQSFRKHSVG